MAAVLEQRTDDPELQQIEALQRTLTALCREVTRLTDLVEAQGLPPSRETRFQLMVFEERRKQAVACLQTQEAEAPPFRISRLERLIEAIGCSWSYFSKQQVAV